MKITSVDIKIDYNKIIERMLEDCEIFKASKIKSKRNSIIGVILTMLIAFGIFILTGVQYGFEDISHPIKVACIFGVIAGLVISWLISICADISYWKFNKLSNSEKEEVVEYIDNGTYKGALDHMSKEAKHDWIKKIPNIFKMYPLIEVVSLIDAGRCSITASFDDDEIIVVDTETMDIGNFDIDGKICETKEKWLKSENVTCVISATRVIIYENGCLDDNLKVNYVEEV